jgi:glycosyltransferase involved in cell wall biosynthesis
MSESRQAFQAITDAPSGVAKSRAKLLLIDGGNLEDFPSGGVLTDFRHMVKVLGSQVAVVGAAVPGCPVGRWSERVLFGHHIQYFSFWHTPRRPNDRPLIPRRIQVLLHLSRFQTAIQASGIDAAYVSSPEVLLAVQSWKFSQLIYRFAGLTNPISIARFRWARLLDWMFRPVMNRALRSASHILTTADDATVRKFIEEFSGREWIQRVRSSTTYFDEDVFHPQPKAQARARMETVGSPIVLSLGRLNRAKGWPLLLTAFSHFRRIHPDAMLYFVGDGEDRASVLQFATSLGVESSIRLTGQVAPDAVSAFLNCADLVVSCSKFEGWPTAVVESVACGIPVVSTSVSGVSSLIVDGVTGFVVPTRDPGAVCAAMERCISLRGYEDICQQVANRYTISVLKREFQRMVPELK